MSLETSLPLRVGIDVGSTTVKIVVLDEKDDLLYADYERHRADIRSTIVAVVSKALDSVEAKRSADQSISVIVTGSGGLSVSKWLSIPFIQEVTAATAAIRK
jgi:activator of 2-hydroxyglutaryl-CoA dehydratase